MKRFRGKVRAGGEESIVTSPLKLLHNHFYSVNFSATVATISFTQISGKSGGNALKGSLPGLRRDPVTVPMRT